MRGARLYVNESERYRLIRAAKKAPPDIRLFILVLIFTGCRISEALNLTHDQIERTERAIIFRCLKKRSQKPVWRKVPIPSFLIRELDKVFHLNSDRPDTRLWHVTRNTAYLWVKDMMTIARIPKGPHQCPKGLRHGFGVHAVLSRVPETAIQEWMGHERLSTTAIYVRTVGLDQRRLAKRMWGISISHIFGF